MILSDSMISPVTAVAVPPLFWSIRMPTSLLAVTVSLSNCTPFDAPPISMPLKPPLIVMSSIVMKLAPWMSNTSEPVLRLPRLNTAAGPLVGPVMVNGLLVLAPEIAAARLMFVVTA